MAPTKREWVKHSNTEPAQQALQYSLRLDLQNTQAVCARSLLATSVLILHLTGEHKIPEIRKLIDGSDRHLHTERNFQNGA